MEALSPHLDEIVRAAIIRASLQMVEEGLVLGTAGNISVRYGDSMLITPSSLPYETLSPADLCVVSLDGDESPVDMSLRQGTIPSAETPLHRSAYLASSRTNAVVHFHGRWTTAASRMNATELPVGHYHTARLGASIPIVKYSHFGSPELTEGVGAALAHSRGVLMGNHGATVTGATLEEAMYNARILEWLCRLEVDTGVFPNPAYLTEADISEVLGIYSRRSAESPESAGQ